MFNMRGAVLFNTKSGNFKNNKFFMSKVNWYRIVNYFENKKNRC